MSHKFSKNRSVERRYLHVPLTYTGIRRPGNRDKELTLIDRLGDHYVAGWRNSKRCLMGMTFLVKAKAKNGKPGFVYKDKWYPVGSYVW